MSIFWQSSSTYITNALFLNTFFCLTHEEWEEIQKVLEIFPLFINIKNVGFFNFWN